MGVSDGSSIMSNNVRNFVGSHCFSDDFAEFELSFLLINFLSLESSLGVIEKSEVFSCFFNGYHIHNTEGISWISSDFMVNLDHAFLVSYNGLNFLGCESVL